MRSSGDLLDGCRFGAGGLGLDPGLENLDDGKQFLGIALAAETVAIYFAEQPIGLGVLASDRWHGAVFEGRAVQIDGDHPARGGERFDGDAVGMFPVSVGVALIPGLQEIEGVHGGHGVQRLCICFRW